MKPFVLFLRKWRQQVSNLYNQLRNVHEITGAVATLAHLDMTKNPDSFNLPKPPDETYEFEPARAIIKTLSGPIEVGQPVTQPPPHRSRRANYRTGLFKTARFAHGVSLIPKKHEVCVVWQFQNISPFLLNPCQL